MENYFVLQLNSYKDIPGFEIYRHYGNTLVFGYNDSQGNKRIRKLLTEMPNDCREFRNAQVWYNHMGFEVGTQQHGRITEVDMPWLGYPVNNLALDDIQRSSLIPGFHGFSINRARELIANTYTILQDFEREHKRVHTEFWTQASARPLNILFHPELDFFPFIDAESFILVNSRNRLSFDNNFISFSRFVLERLTSD